jgi:hypothetical protein
MLPLLAGTIGEGVAVEFKAFLDIYQDLPTWDALFTGSKRISPKADPSALYALSGMISEYLTEAETKKGMEIVEQLPTEFQVLAMRAAIAKKKITTSTAPVRAWMRGAAQSLM